MEDFIQAVNAQNKVDENREMMDIKEEPTSPTRSDDDCSNSVKSNKSTGSGKSGRSRES